MTGHLPANPRVDAAPNVRRTRLALTRIMLMLLAALAAVVPALLSTTSVSATAATGSMLPPFTVGETWNICQGYGGGPTHRGTYHYALDLTGAGCDNSASGRTVRAPKSGTVYYYQPSFGNLCVNTGNGGSYTLTHIYSSSAAGNVITAGQNVGTVAPAGQVQNNGVAHIHFQMWSTPGCYENTNGGIPFDTAHAARICGAPNLTAAGPNAGNGTWSGTRITGQTCGASSSALQPITGDWNGDGSTDIGLRRVSTGMFYFRTGPDWSQSTVSWSAGKGSDLQPITGDWNGDGSTDIGLRRVSTGMFYFRTGPDWSQSTVSWSAGKGSDLQPITGDWNGDGSTDIGLRRVSTGMFYFRTGPDWSQSTVSWSAGKGSDLQPITGDWNGDGSTDIGLRRVSTGMFYFRTGPDWSQSTVSWSAGKGSDLQPITGDWNGDGSTDIGLRRISTGMFYFRTGPDWSQSTVSWSAGKG